MDVASIAAAASSNAMAGVQHEAAVSVLKKTMDIQEQSA
ncbi:MAG: putative motility protein, partial [Zoogloea sp.]|nr:putative motility protein [Zoogloea sp.]